MRLVGRALSEQTNQTVYPDVLLSGQLCLKQLNGGVQERSKLSLERVSADPCCRSLRS